MVKEYIIRCVQNELLLFHCFTLNIVLRDVLPNFSQTSNNCKYSFLTSCISVHTEIHLSRLTLSRNPTLAVCWLAHKTFFWNLKFALNLTLYAREIRMQNWRASKLHMPKLGLAQRPVIWMRCPGTKDAIYHTSQILEYVEAWFVKDVAIYSK